jgi:hypothetical protein
MLAIMVCSGRAVVQSDNATEPYPTPVASQLKRTSLFKKNTLTTEFCIFVKAILVIGIKLFSIFTNLRLLQYDY